MKSLGVLLLFIFGMLSLKGQNSNTDHIRKAEMELKQFADSITMGSTDRVREFSLAAFNPGFLDLLSDPATFNYPFDSLPTISKIYSQDKNVRIYTWIIPSRETGTFKYFGILHRVNPVSKNIKIIGLTDFNPDTSLVTVSELKSDTWYGSVYYEVIEKKINKKTYYFLLGWKGNDRFSTKKVIDVLHFDTWDNPAFGAPLFVDESKKKKHRIVFEYNSQAVMLLSYNKKKKMIVFDHLSPSSTAMKGKFRYYGPDFTYDGLQFKKGIWNYKTNLDLRNSGN